MMMSNDYTLNSETLGVGINRRRVTPISGPSLVRHMAFWLPTASPEDGSPFRARQFDDLIADVLAALRGSASIRGFDSNSWHERLLSLALFSRIVTIDRPLTMCDDQRANLHRAIKFSFLYDHVPIILSFDLHEELATVSFTVDCSDRLNANAEGSSFGKRIEDAFRLLNAGSVPRTSDLSDASNRLFFGFWKELEELLFRANRSSILERVLLDARGLVLAVDDAKTTSDDVVLVQPFSQLKTSERSAPARIATETRPLQPARIGRLMPLLTCQMDSTVEYTLSSLMGRRALYASCLGSGPDAATARSSAPITYLLLADAHNSWQLGRLIYRIHRAGAARLAATKYFEALRERAEMLGGIERDLEDALSKTSSASAVGKGAIEEAREKALDVYRTVEKRLDVILDYGKKEALTYRIDRSRYYVRQFRRAAKALRIDRVEGFQPYDEYVEQRQGSAFEFLDLLGRRYDRLQSDRSLLLRRIQVFSAQINEDEISLAQWTADAALFVVLGPYYAAHVAVEIAHSRIGGDHSATARTIWFGCLVLGIALFAARRKPKQPSAGQSAGKKISAAIPSRRNIGYFTLAILVIAAFYHYESHFVGADETSTTSEN